MSLPALPTFRRMAEEVASQAARTLVRDGHHTSLLFLVRASGALEVAQIVVPEEEDRPVHQYVRAVCHLRRAVAFIYVSEAWMVTLPPGTTREEANYPRPTPRHHPERREVLQVFAMHSEWRAFWTYPFSREGGRIVFGKTIFHEGPEIEGGMADALPGG